MLVIFNHIYLCVSGFGFGHASRAAFRVQKSIGVSDP